MLTGFGRKKGDDPLLKNTMTVSLGECSISKFWLIQTVSSSPKTIFLIFDIVGTEDLNYILRFEYFSLRESFAVRFFLTLFKKKSGKPKSSSTIHVLIRLFFNCKVILYI